MASSGFPTGTYAQYLPKELRRELIRYGAPWPQYIDRLPKDLQRRLFLIMSLPFILRMCKDPYFAWICEDEVFWAQKAGVSVEYLRRYSGDKPLHEAYLYAKYHENTLANIAVILTQLNPEIPVEFHHNMAVDDVVTGAIQREEFSFLHYLLLEYIRGDLDLLFENMETITEHPRVVCWLKEHNVDLSEGEGMVEWAIPVFNKGGYEALSCFKRISGISWGDILLEFAENSNNFRVVKALLDKGVVKKRSVIEDAYRRAVAAGKTRVAEVIRAYLDAQKQV